MQIQVILLAMVAMQSTEAEAGVVAIMMLTEARAVVRSMVGEQVAEAALM